MASFNIGGIIFPSLSAWFQGSTIQVDTSVMVNKADQVSSAITRMEGTFGELQRIVSSTNGYWIGEAAEHHRKMFYDEKEEITAILNRLKEHPSDLKQIAAGYDETERKLTEENQQLQNDYI